MLFFHLVQVFDVPTTTNQPSKNGYDSVLMVRVPYVYPVRVRTRYGYVTTFEVPMLHSMP